METKILKEVVCVCMYNAHIHLPLHLLFYAYIDVIFMYVCCDLVTVLAVIAIPTFHTSVCFKRFRH